MSLHVFRVTESRPSGSARALPFDAGVLADVLRHLDKTIRARQLYPTSNPVYLRGVEQLRAALSALWKHTALVRVQVSETSFLWQGTSVFEELDQGSLSLPWTLYKDGVRELTMQAGFELEEFEWLLEIVPKARHSQEFEDDMLTLLWEREFTFFSYAYVEASIVADEPIELAPTPGRWPPTGTGRTDGPLAAIAATTAGDALQRLLAEETAREDTANIAAALTHEEARQLQGAIGAEYQLDLRTEVVALLAEILEWRGDDALRVEVAGRFDTMFTTLLTGRHFAPAARLLQECDRLRGGPRTLPAGVTSAFAALDTRLNEPAVFDDLLAAIGALESPDAIIALRALFDHFTPKLLEPVLTALGAASHDRLRAVLEATADRLSAESPGELARVILSDEPATALVAAQRAGALQLAVTVPSLGRLLGVTDRALRAAAVQSLIAIGTPPAIKALERTLTDADKQLRLTALRALAENPSPALAPRVTQLVSAPGMRELEHSERRALFELFARVVGEGAVATLDGLLNGKAGLFGKREESDVRACAAMALGRVGTATALDALKKAAADKDPVVKRAASIALDRRDA